MLDNTSFVMTKANFGFPNGIDLVQSFPILKGTGKTHRRLEINEGLIANQKLLNGILNLVFHT